MREKREKRDAQSGLLGLSSLLGLLSLLRRERQRVARDARKKRAASAALVCQGVCYVWVGELSPVLGRKPRLGRRISVDFFVTANFNEKDVVVLPRTFHELKY